MHAQLLEAINLTAQQTQQIISNPYVHVGFEAELLLPVKTYGAKAGAAELLFKQQLNKEVGAAAKKWQLVPDGSIAPDPGESAHGVELVSTPTTINQVLNQIKQVFDLMNLHEIKTNITTGLHVGVSIQGVDVGKINKLKLLLLLDEAHVSDAFDRTFNSYTQSHVELLRKQISQAKKQGRNWIKSRVLLDLIQQLESKIDLKKHRTVNFGKLKQGYLEFRIMGNQDYHKHYDMVRYFVVRYAAVMLAALDETAFAQEYEHQVARMISAALAQAKPEFTDVTHKYAVLGAGKIMGSNQDVYDRFQKAVNSGNEKGAVVLMSMLINRADKHADVTDKAQLINAAATSYRLLIKKHLRMELPEFEKAMTQHGVKPDVVQKIMHYLNTY